jgi:hypothetical protein
LIEYDDNPILHLLSPQAKRDSFSDSGAEGSGTNTPTRGRTMTEGLLRFVQDGSVVRPQTVRQPEPPLLPVQAVQAAPLHQSGRFSALSNPGSFLSGPPGRDSALGREASVIQPVPGPEAQYSQAPAAGQRYLAGQEYGVTPRPFLPLAPSPFHPAPPHYLSYPQPVHPNYVHPNYVPGKSLGSVPPYGAAPVYPGQPALHPPPSPYLYNQLASSSQASTFPPGPMAPQNFPPGLAPASSFQPVAQGGPQPPGGDTVAALRQPVMSSGAAGGYPAYQPGMVPLMVMPQHRYAASFPLPLPGTPSSPPVGYTSQAAEQAPHQEGLGLHQAQSLYQEGLGLHQAQGLHQGLYQEGLGLHQGLHQEGLGIHQGQQQEGLGLHQSLHQEGLCLHQGQHQEGLGVQQGLHQEGPGLHPPPEAEEPGPASQELHHPAPGFDPPPQ